MLKNLKVFLSLFVFWIALCDELSLRQIISGLVASFLTVLIYRWLLTHANMDNLQGISLKQLFRYILLVGKEIFFATYHHIFRVLWGNSDTVVDSIYLDVDNELVASLIANAITLTPGSVTIELNQKHLKVLTYKDVGPVEKTNTTHAFVVRLQNIFK